MREYSEYPVRFLRGDTRITSTLRGRRGERMRGGGGGGGGKRKKKNFEGGGGGGEGGGGGGGGGGGRIR